MTGYHMLYCILFIINTSISINTLYQWCINPNRESPCFSYKNIVCLLVSNLLFMSFSHYFLHCLRQALFATLITIDIASMFLYIRRKNVRRQENFKICLLLIPLCFLGCGLIYFITPF